MAEIILYEDYEFSGRSKVVTSPQDLKDFNDMASSLKVRSGTWTLYEDYDFQGKSASVEVGDYPTIDTIGIKNDTLSSLRPL